MKDNRSSRRHFIKSNSMLGLGALALGNSNNPLAYVKAKTERHDKPNSKVITSIGALTLAQLREKLHTELFERFIPNMDRYAIDHEYGGVMCSLDIRTGELTSTEKTAWFVGRGLWVYSFLYNNIQQDPRYLEIARKSKDLLLTLQPTDNSFWPRTFSREGKPLSGPGDIYGSLFVAEGLFEYARASGESKYRALAKEIIFSCVDRYDQPDYQYHMSYLMDAPDIRGPRVLGHWMIFLSLSTQMLKHEPDEDLEQLAKRSVDAIMNHHLNPQYGLTNEVVNHDFSLPDNAYNQFSVIGHGLETLAFVMFEAARTKDTALFDRARQAFKKHVDVARDAVYGGYFHSIQHIDNYVWDVRKSLWNQQEVMNGSLFLIEHTGDEWALRTFADVYQYSYNKFYKPAYKFWHSGGDRKMEVPNTGLLEHYHHARQLMLGLLAVDRMIERKGAVSGLFA